MTLITINRRIAIICAVMLPFAHLSGQEGRGDLRFVWYNVENFFDPFDDSLTEDEEFLPGSPRRWYWDRFERKTTNICKVIAATGGWRPPEIIGLAEVENNFVMHWLCRESPLLKYNYQWIHEDSPDSRGIDVALMYLPSAFQPLQYAYHRAFKDEGIATRDILHVTGLVHGRDTLHIILNHWPSRWGGVLETEERRKYVAGCCRRIIDSILGAGGRPNILIAGDFNDEPWDASIIQVLGVQPYPEQGNAAGGSGVCSLPLIPQGEKQVPGSLKYRGRWFLFDQIFVSSWLAGRSTGEGLSVPAKGAAIYRFPFLMEKDVQWTGMKPRRTWIGYRYQEGFSDHLPVIVDLYIREKEEMQ